jgi:putative hydrolase of the HAD superfamily
VFPSQLDAVLFDAGGTLVHLDYACIAGIVRARGVALDESALRRAEAASRRAIDAHARSRGGLSGTDATRREGYFGNLLRAAGVEAACVAAILEDLEAANLEANLWRVPSEQAVETLRGLRERRVRTAVVSNADGRCEALLRAAGIAAHLELIVDSHYEGIEKPDPEIFQRALARMRLRPERAVYVGDIYAIDVVGARAAGIAPILIDPAGAYRDADCPRIERLSELLDRLPPRT